MGGFNGAQFNMGGMPKGASFKMSGNGGNIDPNEIFKMFFGGMGGMGGMGGKGGKAQYFTSDGDDNDFGGFGGFGGLGGFGNMGGFANKQNGGKKTSFKFSS
jgi:hypothetical protein